MILFTIAFDPIIRWIDSLLSPIGSSLFGYCDDLSVACRNMIEAWGILLKLFRIVTLISSLQLNVRKTQVWIIRPASRTRIQPTFQSVSFDLMDSLFKDYIKHISILLGPGAMQHKYDELIRGYQEIVAFLRGIDADFITTIALYNILRKFKT